MTLLGLLVIIIVIGLIVWLVQQLPLAQPFKNIALVLVVVVCIIWLLSASGLGGLGNVRLS